MYRKEENGELVCELTNLPPDIEDTCENLFLRRTSKGKRFTNYLIDLVCVYILALILGLTIGAIGSIAPDIIQILDNKWLFYLLGIILPVVYYTVLESDNGRTVGKYITKTKVVMETGKKPDFKTILIRSLCRCIPLEQFSFLGDEGLHDRLSKTSVIDI
jgi:uncharacterized RDD family membrane protein YckC